MGIVGMGSRGCKGRVVWLRRRRRAVLTRCLGLRIRLLLMDWQVTKPTPKSLRTSPKALIPYLKSLIKSKTRIVQ